MTTRITTNHSACSHGTPIFIDGENNPIDYADGLRRLISEQKWGTQKEGCTEIARLTGVSTRTVEGWLQGRMPQKQALLLLMGMLGNDKH